MFLGFQFEVKRGLYNDHTKMNIIIPFYDKTKGLLKING